MQNLKKRCFYEIKNFRVSHSYPCVISSLNTKHNYYMPFLLFVLLVFQAKEFIELCVTLFVVIDCGLS